MEDKFSENFDTEESVFRQPDLEKALKEFNKANSDEPNLYEDEADITTPEFAEDETESITQNNTTDNNIDDFKEENTQNQNNQEDITHWEETDDDNSVVKKYIVYVSRDYVPYIDNLSLDERSAFINDALEIKINQQNVKKQLQYRKKLVLHFIIAMAVVFVTFPFALLGVHKAIMATFENYKYSQDNFEKLYKHKFEKDKAYMRSVQYNKMLEKRAKSN